MELTDREKQIIMGLCNGVSLRGIAEVLHGSYQALRQDARVVYAKLGAENANRACYLWGKHERSTGGSE